MCAGMEISLILMPRSMFTLTRNGTEEMWSPKFGCLRKFPYGRQVNADETGRQAWRL